MESLSPTQPLSFSLECETQMKRRRTSFVCPNENFDRWRELPADVFQFIANFVDRENKISLTCVCTLWNRIIKERCMVNVRNIPELQELGIQECQDPAVGRESFRQLKSVIDLVGGIECFKMIPLFNQTEWPEESRISSLRWNHVPAPIVRGKTSQGCLYIIFCYHYGSDQKVGYLLQNGIGKGWSLSFGYYRLERTRSYNPFDPAYFTRSQGMNPGNPNNTIDKVNDSMNVLKRLFRMHAGLEKDPIPFNRTTSHGTEKGAILLREFEIASMEISDDDTSGYL